MKPRMNERLSAFLVRAGLNPERNNPMDYYEPHLCTYSHTDDDFMVFVNSETGAKVGLRDDVYSALFSEDEMEAYHE